jgi:NAD(P)H-nitrite reductase large subunit
MHDVLIVGGGQAGAQAAISLRQGGFTGSITIAGEEADPPYERPPLSKDYLAGDKTADRLALRPAAFWSERNVTLLLGQRVVAVDAATHIVTTAAGSTLGYGVLIWAAGGHARALPLPGGDLPGVHSIRSRADVDRLTADLATATDVVNRSTSAAAISASKLPLSCRRRASASPFSKRRTASSPASPAQRCRASTRPSIAPAGSTSGSASASRRSKAVNA